MRKKVLLSVPVYLKKYLLNPEFGKVVDGTLHVGRWSYIGSYIISVSRPIPYILPKPENNGSRLVIYYSSRERSHEVPPEKLASLAKSLDEMFRRSLVCEVRALHEMCGGDYSRFIERFLLRYGIVPDVDINFDTARKIYRDYLERVDKKQREKERILR